MELQSTLKKCNEDTESKQGDTEKNQGKTISAKDDQDIIFIGDTCKKNTENEKTPVPIELNEPTSNKLLDVDEYLVKVGEFGKAQKIILLFVYLMYIPHGYHTISMYFTGHSPAWRCSGNAAECNITGTFDVGDEFYEKRCLMNRSSWEYVEETSYSIVTEWDLICEKKVYPFISTSIFWCGWGIGALVFGWAINRFGRKRTFFLSWTFGILAKLGSAISTQFWLYSFFEFGAGFNHGGIALVIAIIVSELVGPRYKSIGGACIGFTYTLSVCFLAMQGWLLLNWRQFLIITTAPYLILIPAYRIIPESFRWLRIKNRLTEAEEILQRFCKINGKELPTASLKPAVESDIPSLRSSNIFKYKSFLVLVVIQCLIWLINGQVFIGIAMAADQLGGNIFRDFILTKIAGLPAAYITMLGMSKFGRKPTIIVAFGFTCLSCIVVTLMDPTSKYIWGRISSGMFGTLCMTIAFFGMYIWSLEILPTVIRSQVMGVTSLMTRFGACSAPWVAQLLEHVHHTLSFATLGGAAFLAVLLCTQLPETRGRPTAETLEDTVRSNRNGKKDINCV